MSTLSRNEKQALENEASELRDGKTQDKICGCIPASEGEASKAFKQMMDFSLLKDAVFIMFAISNFFTSIGFNVPYVYLAVSHAK